MATITSYIVPFVFVLGIIIIVHEMGHYILAKLTGIRVERFSIGFPPRLFGKKIGDTDYCVSAVPFGGYVKMSGMIDESMDADGIKGEPYEFMSKPVWIRMLVILAGPFFNVFLTMLIFSAAVFIEGIPEPVGPVVGRVMEKMPAAELGLQPGDVITSIDGEPVDTWKDLVRLVSGNAENQISIQWQRKGEIMSSQITPRLDKLFGIGLIGVEPQTTRVRPGVFRAFGSGLSSTWSMIKLLGKSFKLLFNGEVSLREGLAGPVRIAQMAGDSAKSGFGSLVIFMAFLSLNLGIINLLPIPVLDGGHMVFLTIEAVMRKPISAKIKLVIQQVGMAVLLALMLLVIFNDFSHIF